MTASERVALWRKNNPEKDRQLRAKYREKHKERRKVANNEYKAKNKLRIKEYSRLRYLRDKEKIRSINRAWVTRHPEKYKAVRKADRKNTLLRYHSDINFKLAHKIRGRIKRFITKGIGNRYCKSLDLLGINIDEVKMHLELQFKPGMSWENYSYKGWHIDHIIPCSSFDLTDPEQQRKCFHYTNLQPLWWYENLAKGDKLAA